MGETALEVRGARLHVRDVGHGDPLVILHGGPDFDHAYFLPEMDGLADGFRLVYYDQRGRGRSTGAADEVTIESEMEDLDAVRRLCGQERVALLGHSWGALLALEYATRHPERVAALVLMNPAPASHADFEGWRAHRRSMPNALGAEMERIAQTPAYEEGDLEADAASYRLHFAAALSRPDLVEVVVSRLRTHFTPRGVLDARAIEGRLHEQTWNRPGYDLLPMLRALAIAIPTLVLHGEADFFPVGLARNIADAIPGARLVVLAQCGHFAYLERTAETFAAIRAFLRERAMSFASA